MIAPRMLLRLYPRAWRERYGDEMVALLEQSGVSRHVAVNLIAGAARERGRSWLRLRALSEQFEDLRCPHCLRTISQEQWLALWMGTGVMSGTAVRPCEKCGALLRLSPARRFAQGSQFVCLTLMLLSNVFNIEHAWSARVVWTFSGLIFVFLCASLIAQGQIQLQVVPLDHGEERR